MLHPRKRERKRDLLPGDLSLWPSPDDSKRWTLRLNFAGPYECQLTQLQTVLQAAFTRQDIDTLSVHNAYMTLSSCSTCKDLMTKLLAQDRDWKVVYFSERTSDLHLELEWLELFQPVRYLTFRWSHGEGRIVSNVSFIAQMIAMLRVMPNLEELDFMRMSFPLSDFVLFCKDAFLAQKIARMGLILRPGDESFPTFPCFPNLASFSLRVEAGTSPLVRSQCMKQVSTQWKNLYRLTIHDTHTVDQAEPFRYLADCVSNPLCSLRGLEIDLNCKQHKPENLYMQQFICALGDNRSIRELSLTLGKDSFFFLSSLLPLLANKTNRIHHLGLLCYQGVPVGGEETRDVFTFLLDWQLQMRSIRLVRIGIKRNQKIRYVSRIHERWQKWQSYLQEDSLAPSSPSLMGMDRAFWANELERIDKTNNPELSCLSLDATYFLLQQWLSGISAIPRTPSGLQS